MKVLTLTSVILLPGALLAGVITSTDTPHDH
jgi:hypothetical protein